MRNIEMYAENYERLPFEDKQVQFRLRAVIENINKFEHHNILEIGCGTSPLFVHFDDYCAMTVVEPSSRFFQNAQLLAADNPRVTCRQGFFEEVVACLPEVQYDMIIISSILHELKDPVPFLEAVKKICSHKTVVHINVPNANSLHRILAKEMGLIENVHCLSAQNIQMQQHSVFSLHSLRELIESCGLNVMGEGSYFIKPFSHQQMAQCLDNRIFDDRLLEGLYLLEKYFSGYGSEIYLNCRVVKY